MIIPTELAIAFVCPYCNRLIFNTFSLFDLKAGSDFEISCECDGKPCAVGLDENHMLYIILWGRCCDDPHEFDFYLEEFQEDTILGLACEESNLGLGFIGSPRMVKLATEDCVLPVQI